MERHPSADLSALLEQARWLRGLAAHLVHRRAEVDDLVQETWLQALRSPPSPDRPPRPWLGRVLHNAWRMAGRASTRRRARELAAVDPAPAVASAEQLLERAQIQRRLAELVMRLDEPYRTAILLFYYEGRPGAEIAGALGVPAGTVRWRINQGLAQLRARLDEDDGAHQRGWRLVLLPLAGHEPAAPGPGVTAASPVLKVLSAVGLTAALGGGAALWFARPAPQARPQPPAAVSRDTTTKTVTPEEEETMTQSRMKKLAVFFGVAVPAMVAAAQDEKPLSRDEAIGFCVEFRERTVVCKEELSHMFADMVPPGTSPEAKEKIRQKALKEIEEDGTGPLEPRRAKCARSIDRGLSFNEGDVKTGRACMAEKDCKKSVACIRPLFEAKHKKR
jgi:RNA polymerase sigma-70 factor (ECF subfamily)